MAKINVAKLKAEIESMKRTRDAANTSPNVKKALEGAIANAEKKLAEAEKFGAAPAEKKPEITASHKDKVKKSATKGPGGSKKLLSTKALIAKYAGTPGTNLLRDAHRPAKAPGKRKSANGKVYYENRANRSDLRHKYPLLEDGGAVEETEVADSTKTMKTSLPESIKTIDEAKAFLTDLYNNGESYHPEDSAEGIVWNNGVEVSPAEAEQLDSLMSDIYMLPGNDGRHNDPLAFDPAGFLLELDPDYNKMVADDNEEDTVYNEDGNSPGKLSAPEHFGSGENINVYGYETQNFDNCRKAVDQFKNAITSIDMDSESTHINTLKTNLKNLAEAVDNILGIEKNVVDLGITVPSQITILSVYLQTGGR